MHRLSLQSPKDGLVIELTSPSLGDYTTKPMEVGTMNSKPKVKRLLMISLLFVNLLGYYDALSSPTQLHLSTASYEVKADDRTEKEKILSYIVEKFGEDAADAITIINKCENHAFNPEATNWNKNGTWDRGIFQINQVHGYSWDEMGDWEKNIDAAYKIFKRRGWSAWACSSVVGVKSFWE